MKPDSSGALTRIELKPPQSRVFNNRARFRSLVAGRRFGKTFLACVELYNDAASGPDRVDWYVAPTYRQAKRIAWKQIKKICRGRIVSKDETDLSLVLPNGSLIGLRGADNYDSLRGDGLNFLVCDEYASMKPAAWTEVLRPALSDKMGRALFIGTPAGFNHFHKLHDDARTQPDWAAFEFTTLDGGNVSAEEIVSASRDLDEKMFRQEYEASFETIGAGKAYYAFSREKNLSPGLVFNRNLPLAWSLDFNINPMCSVIGQAEDVSTRQDVFAGRVEKKLRILEEICLPDSTIDAACREFCRRTEPYRKAAGGQLAVNIYGDASGHNRTHSGATNWQVVEEFFRSRGEYRISLNVTRANPLVRDRTNAVNAALCNSIGVVRIQIDPQCKQLVADMEQVSWKADSNGNLTGELDKSDPNRTHVSDAFGYFVWAELPIRQGQSVYGQGFIG